MSRENKNEPKVTSLYELLAIVALTISLLILFFPKNSIEKLIDSEKRNYDLTIIYLKNIANAYANNPKNWLRLINAYLGMGKIKEAKEAFELFQKNAKLDEEHSKILNYHLIKGRYKTQTDKNEKTKLSKELKKELKEFLKSDNPSLWYFVLNESAELGLKKIRFDALKKRVRHEKNIDENEVIKAFFLAKEIEKKEEGLKLLKYGVSNSKSEKLFNLLISHYSLKKEYKKMAKEYEKRFLKYKRPDLFFDTAGLYFQIKDEKKALSFIKEHQKSFIKDSLACQKIIKLYLSYKKLDDAKSFVTLLSEKNGALLRQNPKLLRLFLKVSLYNGDLKNAQKLADTGVKYFKKDIYWKKEALQIALWKNDTLKIKKYAKELLFRDKSDKYLNILQNLASSSHDSSALKKIYIRKLLKRYNKEYMKKLYELYKKEGNFKEGADFFESYYKKERRTEILKSKILLQSEYEDFDTVEESFINYSKIFRDDHDLLYKYAAKLFSKKRYQKVYDLLYKNSKKSLFKKKELWYLFANSAYITQKEQSLFEILKQMQKLDILRKSDFERLFFLSVNRDEKYALFIAEKDFQNNPSKNSFYRLASILSKSHIYERLYSVIKNLDEKLSQKLEKESYFHLVKADIWQRKKRYKKALREFREAIKIDPKSKEIHTSYLWFLLSYKNKNLLERELDFISKNFPFDSNVAQATALGYFTLQFGTKAKKQMKFALQNDPLNWQLHLQYADILSLSEDDNERQKQMLIAKNLAQKEIKEKNGFKNDKSKLYDYTRIKIHFDPLSVKKYLKEVENLLDLKTIYQLYASTLIDFDATQKIKSLINAHKIDDFYITLYMALNQNDGKKLLEIKNENRLLPLNDHLRLLKSTGAKKEYERLLFESIQNNENGAFSNEFYEYVMNKKPTIKSEFKHSNLSGLKYDQIKLSYRHKNFKNLDLVTSVAINKNIKSGLKNIKNQNSLSFELYKSFKNYKLSLKTDFFNKTKNYLGFEAKLSHKHKRADIQVAAKINQNNQSSNYLLLYAKENSLKTALFYKLNRNESVSLGYKHARYKDMKRFLGSSDQIFANYRLVLKKAYPDISIGVSSELQKYTKDDRLPKSFMQIAFDMTYGLNAKERFQRSWKSYANGVFLYNNRSKYGYIIQAGYGGEISIRDYLGFEIEYSSANKSRLQEYFSWKIRYLFW